MAKIRNEVRINASPADVWKIVRDYGNVHAWSPLVRETKVEGKVRHCTLAEGAPAPGGVLHEEVLLVDDRTLRLEYSVVGAPFHVAFHGAAIEVFPNDGGSLVVWTTNVEPDELAAGFSPGFDASLAGLKRAAER
ncbi:MAG: SRPBCC family protein [Chloroflexi bacterium]|nr:SRPBCC family protein [Chloroflexota bacterium]MBI4288059.1 SRPBCC family protein [Chloroflexota bacterium]